jgi:hypothetical protein
LPLVSSSLASGSGTGGPLASSRQDRCKDAPDAQTPRVKISVRYSEPGQWNPIVLLREEEEGAGGADAGPPVSFLRMEGDV